MDENKQLLEELQDMNTETLIREFKYNHNLTPEQEGLYILQIMQKEGYTRHKEVADKIGVSRSFVSLRIKSAKTKYGNIISSRPVGRPKHTTIELDEIYGENVPIRLISKLGDMAEEELARKLLVHVLSVFKEKELNPFIEIKETQIYNVEELKTLLEKV